MALEYGNIWNYGIGNVALKRLESRAEGISGSNRPSQKNRGETVRNRLKLIISEEWRKIRNERIQKFWKSEKILTRNLDVSRKPQVAKIENSSNILSCHGTMFLSTSVNTNNNKQYNISGYGNLLTIRLQSGFRLIFS